MTRTGSRVKCADWVTMRDPSFEETASGIVDDDDKDDGDYEVDDDDRSDATWCI
uniref:Uncharacterized protein n=1 Tax=Hyaloperonospora arabidopsidis (strain Emoy2) TaxID=559515 RepID=M4B5L2_HYAAE